MLVFKPEEDTGLAHVPVVFGSKESVVPFCIGRRYRDESAEVCMCTCRSTCIFEREKRSERLDEASAYVQW